MSSGRPALLVLLIGLAIALAAPPAGAQGGDEEQRAAWQQRLRSLKSELAAARTRSAEARATYSRMRARRRLRGDARAAVVAEVEAAEQAAIAAERKLEAFREDARRAGVPPGWLRLPDAGPAAPSR